MHRAQGVLTMGQLRILSEKDVRSVLDTSTALDLARRTLIDQAAGHSLLSSPSAMSLDARPVGGPKFKFKAAAVGYLNASGIRLLSHPGPTTMNTNYCAVYDHAGYQLSGLVSDHWLSRLRTAAFGAVSVQALVNPGPLVVALFGTGGIASEIAPMLAQALDVKELRVTSRQMKNMEAFIAAQAGDVQAAMRAEPDGHKAVDGADLVVTLTESPSPLVFGGTLKPGAVVCSMGSYNEVDYPVLAEADRFIVDDMDFAAEMGDGGAWIEQGHLTQSTFRSRVDALACEVLSGTKPGRKTPSDRIMALIQGMAIGDVAFAAHALREGERRGLGRTVPLD
jgi:ornithine cyclodeaminase/alanine dehydrogenase-like protein (mu-crystallin family)